jgi:hypothetical protein
MRTSEAFVPIVSALGAIILAPVAGGREHATRHLLFGRSRRTRAAQHPFSPPGVVKNSLIASISLHAALLLFAPDGMAGALVLAENRATAALCVGFREPEGILCLLFSAPADGSPSPSPPSDFSVMPVEVPFHTKTDSNNNLASIHSFGDPAPKTPPAILYNSRLILAAGSLGSNVFNASATYEIKFAITGFINPMIKFHFQEGEVTVTETNSGVASEKRPI